LYLRFKPCTFQQKSFSVKNNNNFLIFWHSRVEKKQWKSQRERLKEKLRLINSNSKWLGKKEEQETKMKKDKDTHCKNSTLMNAAEALAIVSKAVVERTMVVSSVEGLETEVSARSTILIWMVWPGMQVRGTRALIHRTKYCLPHAAPLSHIPSPAAPNRLLDGNCSASLPKQAVAIWS